MSGCSEALYSLQEAHVLNVKSKAIKAHCFTVNPANLTEITRRRATTAITYSAV